MSTRLFVARLPLNTTDHTLKTLFEQQGTVASARVIMDRATSRSKGFGFVEMDTADKAESAIKALDGKEFEGQTIAVSLARSQASNPQSENYKKRSDSFQSGFKRR